MSTQISSGADEVLTSAAESGPQDPLDALLGQIVGGYFVLTDGQGSVSKWSEPAELEAERVVVGLPLSLSGADSAQTTETRAFAERLQGSVRVPVELYDERFTTALAGQAGGSASLDSRAAAVLLNEWLTVFGHLPIEGTTD